MMTADEVDGSATTYCHVPVLLSKMSWMVGWGLLEVSRAVSLLSFCETAVERLRLPSGREGVCRRAWVDNDPVTEDCVLVDALVGGRILVVLVEAPVFAEVEHAARVVCCRGGRRR